MQGRRAILRAHARLGWPRRRAGHTAALGLLLAALVGCALDEAPMPGNLSPRTYLSVTGDSLNVTLYRTILHWWGTDMDGRVIGYAYRWDGPWHPQPGDSLWWEDATWVFTDATLDTFDVPIRGAYAERTFVVRAIDDQRRADPTGVSQRFRLSNNPPIVSWSDTTRHPTVLQPSLPAISFAWTPEDYDGRRTIAYTRLWLDVGPGEDSAASAVTVVSDTVGAFFPQHFQGRYGERSVYCQVFDRAQTGSNVIHWSWTVVPPRGEYLLIDNAGGPATGPHRTDDQFWRARMEAVVPGNVHVYDVAVDGVFRSRQEILPLLSLFKGVVWYGGFSYDGSLESDAALRSGLELAATSFYPYVSSGGRLLLTAHNLVGTNGGLPQSFWRERFGIDRVFTHQVQDEVISDFTIPRNVYVRCGPALDGVDSLKVNSPLGLSDFFRLSPSPEPLLWFDPATLDTLAFPEHVDEPLYVGALARWNDGRMVLCTAVLSRFRDGGQGTPETAVESLLRNLFQSP